MGITVSHLISSSVDSAHRVAVTCCRQQEATTDFCCAAASSKTRRTSWWACSSSLTPPPSLFLPPFPIPPTARLQVVESLSDFAQTSKPGALSSSQTRLLRRCAAPKAAHLLRMPHPGNTRKMAKRIYNASQGARARRWEEPSGCGHGAVGRWFCRKKRRNRQTTGGMVKTTGGMVKTNSIRNGLDAVRNGCVGMRAQSSAKLETRQCSNARDNSAKSCRVFNGFNCLEHASASSFDVVQVARPRHLSVTCRRSCQQAAHADDLQQATGEQLYPTHHT